MEEKESHKPINPDSSSGEPEQAKENDESISPDQILEALPEEDRGKVLSIIKQSFVSGVMRRNNPIAEKITSDHISQIISKSDEQDKRDRDERKGERNYNLIIITIGLVFVGAILVFFQEDKDFLLKILFGILGFIGGFGAGKASKKKGE